MQQDQFGRLLPTFIQVIDLTDQEESEYWAVVSAVFDGRQLDDITSTPRFTSAASTSMETSINNKVSLSPCHCEAHFVNDQFVEIFLLKFALCLLSSVIALLLHSIVMIC